MRLLNKKLALSCKGILSFDGLNKVFSDIDGVHTCKNYKVVIEEKYEWKDLDKDTYYIRDEIYFDKRPAILLCTKNHKDISGIEDKIILMNESRVIGFYDNTNGEFQNYIETRYPNQPISAFYRFGINRWLDLWTDYLKNKGVIC